MDISNNIEHWLSGGPPHQTRVAGRHSTLSRYLNWEETFCDSVLQAEDSAVSKEDKVLARGFVGSSEKSSHSIALQQGRYPFFSCPPKPRQNLRPGGRHYCAFTAFLVCATSNDISTMVLW